MENTFNNLVNKIQKLPLRDKEELKYLLERYVIEERRDEIYKNYKASTKEEKKMKFTSNINELKKSL